MGELKQGDTAIVTTLRRTTKGLEICIRTHEAVEEFMRANAGEETTQVDIIGRQWRRIGDSTPLEVYEIPPDMTGSRLASQKVAYRIDQPGRNLVTVDMHSGAKTINMSFLRLVGSSAADGVTFNVTGVHSEEDVQWMATAIRDASRAIYTQYMKSMQIDIELEDQLPPRHETLRGAPVILTDDLRIPF